MNENIKKEIEKVLREEIAYIVFDETSTKEKYALYGFLLKKFSRNVGSDTDLVNELTMQLMSADKNTKTEFVDTFFDGVMDNLRICDTCGDWMIEGYVLGDEYACSRECAILNYMGTSFNHSDDGNVSREEAIRLFDKDLELDNAHDLGEVYYTDWR